MRFLADASVDNLLLTSIHPIEPGEMNVTISGFKTLAIGLGVALAFVTGFVIYQFSSLSALKKQNHELTAAVADHNGKALAASKRECADRAGAVFRSMGYSDRGDAGKSGLDSQIYTNHYNPELQRCMMEIVLSSYQAGDSQVVQRMLFDADERTDFGDYSWVSSTTKKYYDQKPIVCKMTPPGKDEAACHSTDEWEAYVKSLMS